MDRLLKKMMMGVLLLGVVSCDYVQDIPVKEVLTPIAESDYNFTNSDQYEVEVVAKGVHGIKTTCDEILLKVTDRRTGMYSEYTFNTSDLKNDESKKGRYKISKTSNEDQTISIDGVLNWTRDSDLHVGTGYNPFRGAGTSTMTVSSSTTTFFFGEFVLKQGDEKLLKVKYEHIY